MMSRQEEKNDTGKEREPGVYVYCPGETDPLFEYDPEVDLPSELDQISEERKVTGCLTKRNSTRSVVKVLPAGDYDFHIPTQLNTQPRSR
jgi:hypothetical protein